MNKFGRPSKYNDELADKICLWIGEGKSLNSFCKTKGAPHLSTVTRWIVAHDDFRNKYVRAREAAGHAHGDNVIDVIQLLRKGDVDAQTARVMIDALKWSAERMAPRAYAPSQTVDNISTDGSMTPQVVERVIVKPNADE